MAQQARSIVHSSVTYLTTNPSSQVNNSGATWGEDIETYPDSAFTKLMVLNVQRVFTLTQKLLPLLKRGYEQNGVARVINVGVQCLAVCRVGEW
jgi:short-subunit dehydrogenase